MTNGEKLKEIFPSIELYEKSHDAIQINFDSVWWNAEYEEPTTKNNLAHNLCDSCTNIRCEFQSGIVRTKCAFYMPPQHLSGLEKNSKKLEKDFGELDCISRADVIKILGKIEQLVWEGEGFDYEESRAMIDELPSATPQEPRWIPVSERLPEPNARDGLIARHYLIQNEYGDMLVARYDGKRWEQMYQHKYLEDEVIAWMPLPTSYQGEKNE